MIEFEKETGEAERPIRQVGSPSEGAAETAEAPRLEIVRTRKKYVLSPVCIQPEILANPLGYIGLNCGCLECHPDFYCDGSPDAAAKCGLEARFPVSSKRPRWCFPHFVKAHERGEVTDEQLAEARQGGARGRA